MADVGQEEDFEAARTKALNCGASGFFLVVSIAIGKMTSFPVVQSV